MGIKETGNTLMDLYKSYGANEDARMRNRIRTKEAAIRNQTREVSNAHEIEVNKLQRWVQSRNSQLAAKSVGSALEANTANLLRGQTRRGQQDFAIEVQSAEQAGNAVAQAALSGVAGSVTQVVQGTMALKESIMRERLRRVGVTEISDSARRAGAIMAQLSGTQDMSILNPRMDYNVDRPDLEATRSTVGMLAEAGVKLAMQAAGQPPAKGDSTGPITLQSLFSSGKKAPVEDRGLSLFSTNPANTPDALGNY